MRKRKFKVILDCDDVLLSCNQFAIDKLNAETGSDFRLSDIRSWGTTGTGIDARLRYYEDENFVLSQPPLPGAVEFVQKLMQLAEVFICTSVPAHCAGARVSSIIKNFPMIEPGNILIGNRKDLLRADMILDDGYHNLSKSQVDYPVLFRKPWNHEITGLLSVSNYDEFLTLVQIIQKNQYEIIAPGNKIVTMVGPSGSGKTAIVEELLKDNTNFIKVRSYTTRQRRNENEDYHFVTEEEFLKKLDEGFFFETSSYMGQYYGTSKEDVDAIIAEGKNAVMVLDINGAIAMKRAYGPAALNLFVTRNKECCVRSVLSRNLPIDETAKRITSLDAELRNEEFCDVVINNDGSIMEAVKLVKEAVA